jgi:hypothetical protein
VEDKAGPCRPKGHLRGFVYWPDVEDITSKTGNFKKFGVFVRMLVSALQSRSDSVFVDLLTYNDLVGDSSRGRTQGERAFPLAD